MSALMDRAYAAVGELILAFVRALAVYFEPGPGDSLFDVVSTGGSVVTAPADDDPLGAAVLCEIPAPPSNRGCIISGISMAPKAMSVRYILEVNGNKVLDIDHQVTPDLFTLYPVRLRVDSVRTIRLLCVSNTNLAVPTNLGRIAGWWLSGDDVEPRRVIR